jgi:hypothetical protein
MRTQTYRYVAAMAMAPNGTGQMHDEAPTMHHAMMSDKGTASGRAEFVGGVLFPGLVFGAMAVVPWLDGTNRPRRRARPGRPTSGGSRTTPSWCSMRARTRFS